MKKALLSLAILAASFASTVNAQDPPDAFRWSGQTALTQAQGYSQGDPLHLTWGFALDGMTVPFDGTWGAQANNLNTRFTGIYGSQAAYQAVFQQTFDRWAELSGLEYTFEANDDGAALPTQTSGGGVGISGVRADVRIAGKALDGNNGVLAYNWFPNAGDMVIDTNDSFFNNVANNSQAVRNVIAHEHGHGLGFQHVNPVNFDFLMEPFATSNPTFDGPQYHDIFMAHRAYGDVNEKSNGQLGNDIFSRATGMGTIADGGTASIGDDARDFFVNPNEVDFVSIDDQSDTDFYSFTVNQASTADIVLEALGETYDIGANGGSTAPFDTSMRSDLTLTVFDQDGTTVLGSSNATGLGGSETLNGLVLNSAGTYFVRITGQDNGDGIVEDTQFYGLNIGITATPVPEPASMAIVTLCGLALYRRRRA